MACNINTRNIALFYRQSDTTCTVTSYWERGDQIWNIIHIGGRSEGNKRVGNENKSQVNCGRWKLIYNPFNTVWTLPSIVLGRLKSSAGVKGLKYNHVLQCDYISMCILLHMITYDYIWYFNTLKRIDKSMQSCFWDMGI